MATSKDITIGPTAVLSLLVSQVLAGNVNKRDDGSDIYPPVIFAACLAFVMGFYQIIVGFFQLGIIFNFIPATVISGFTTGAAIT